MKHWGKGFSPHFARNSSLNMALPSHMRAHAWRHSHPNIRRASPPSRHPCWHFGEKYPPPTPIYLPPLHSTHPHPPPVAADVPRSVAYHLLPPSTSPPPHPISPPPFCTTLPIQHSRRTLGTTKEEDFKSHIHTLNQIVHASYTRPYITGK